MQESSGFCLLSEGMQQWANRILNGVILGAFATLVVALTLSPLSNNDIWQHLKSGQMLLQTHHFQYIDPYSCSATGAPWINEEWLSGVIFYLAYLIGGVNGVIFLKGFVILLMTGVVLVNCQQLRISLFFSIPLTIFMIFNVGMRFLARPEIFSYVFLAAYLYILMNYKYQHTSRKTLVVLPILQIFWANMHGSFILGIFVPIIFIGCETIRLLASHRFALCNYDIIPWDRLKPLYIIFPLTVLACFINPYGMHLLVQPFHVVIENRELIKTIFEWQSPFESNLFRESYAFDYYVGWMVLLGLSFLANIRRLDLSNIAMSLFFLVMAFEMHRNITLLTIATCPIICLNFHKGSEDINNSSVAKPNRGFETVGRLVILILLVPLVVLSFKYGYFYNSHNSKPFGLGVAPNMPIKATEYIKANNIKGCCFNSYTYGAYLIFHCFPDTRVIMDSRAEHVYGREYYGYYQRALGEVDVFKDFLERYDVAYIMLNYRLGSFDKHCAYLKMSGQWAMVYFDEACFIYVRRLPKHEDLISRDEFRYLHPLLSTQGFQIRREEMDAVAEECRRNLKTNPDFFISHAILLDFYTEKRDWPRVIEHGTVVIARNPAYHDGYMKLGIAYTHLHHFDAARQMHQKAISISPTSRAAHEALARIEEKHQE